MILKYKQLGDRRRFDSPHTSPQSSTSRFQVSEAQAVFIKKNKNRRYIEKVRYGFTRVLVIFENTKMSELRWKCRGLRSVIVLFTNFALAFAFVSAERGIFDSKARESDEPPSFFLDFLWEPDQTGYHHVWPVSSFSLWSDPDLVKEKEK